MMQIPVRTTASDEILSVLREDVLSLALSPGELLNINVLAEQLQVSRSPVRDALMKLSRDNLVDVFPQKGTRVSLIDLDRVEEERFLRSSLEENAARIFARTRLESDIALLQAAITRQKEAAASQDYVAFIKSDDEFHRVVFASIGKLWCWDTIMGLCGNHHRIRLLSFRIPHVLDGIIDQHQDMVEVFISQDEDAAGGMEKAHLSKLKNETAQLLDMYPTYFKKGRR